LKRLQPSHAHPTPAAAIRRFRAIARLSEYSTRVKNPLNDSFKTTGMLRIRWNPDFAGRSGPFATVVELRRHPSDAIAAAVLFQAMSGYSRNSAIQEEITMADGPHLSLAEIDRRIAIARDNIRQLIEQAAAFSGAEDEDRNADRIAHQTEELEKLVKQRDALQKK
jgi:hypothetical protein